MEIKEERNENMIYACNKCGKIPKYGCFSYNDIEISCDCKGIVNENLESFLLKSQTVPNEFCHNHSENQAILYCVNCSKWLCKEC